MNDRERAIVRYLEFNLIGLIETLKPLMRDDANPEEMYDAAYHILEEVKRSLNERTGVNEKSN